MQKIVVTETNNFSFIFFKGVNWLPANSPFLYLELPLNNKHQIMMHWYKVTLVVKYSQLVAGRFQKFENKQ